MTQAAPFPQPPTRPQPNECCGRGCCPCIFDYYNDALNRWREAMMERGIEPDEIPDATPWQNGERAAPGTR